ncbi:All-trans-zeta-carotene desaturase [Paraconexibacter sp. AEG42_29]|uniref:All-trans-zeta-carotene desaturase n=1 Tax=Paraconexibacter sp. AEG42_29 TaxID=2997339 RepID=A0AAU7AYM8_9ACTN
MSEPGTWDAIVVGAGLAGLTAGAYLAAAGRRVIVLEAGDAAGGSSHVFRRKNEWEFDVGVHHLGNCGPDGLLPMVLRGLALEDRIEFLPFDPDRLETYVLPGLQFEAPKGLDRYEEALVGAFPADSRGIRRFMRVMRGIGGALDRAAVPSSLRDFGSFGVRAPQWAAWAYVPLQRLYDLCGLSAQAQLVLSTSNVSYLAPPSRAPVGMHAAFLWDFIEKGGTYPKGGGQVFAAHLTDVVRTHGGTVRTQARVEEIVIAEGRVAGVRLTDGEALAAPVVLSAADVKRTLLGMVGREHLKLRTARRVEGGRMCQPYFTAYLGVDLDLAGRLPNTDHLSFPTWDPIEDVFAMTRGPRRRTDAWMDDLARRMPAYIHSSTIKDPGTARYAPAGHTNLEAMFPITGDLGLWGLSGGPADGGQYRDNTAYLELKEHLVDVMIDRVDEAIPGVKEHVVWREGGTPVTQERYTTPTGGTAYGLEIAVDQFAQRGRWGVRTEIPGLFLAGASCTWGPGIEGVMHSGMYAAAAITGRDLAREVRGGAVIADAARLSPVGPDWDPLGASRRLAQKPAAAQPIPVA